MIVLDASAAVELLMRTDTGARVARRLAQPGESLHAPHLIDIEVAQVLRRQAALGAIAPERCRDALSDLTALALRRYPHGPLLLYRAWELRQNLTAYDAAYVALSEFLEAPLLTCDRRLAQAPGHDAEIEIV